MFEKNDVFDDCYFMYTGT